MVAVSVWVIRCWRLVTISWSCKITFLKHHRGDWRWDTREERVFAEPRPPSLYTWMSSSITISVRGPSRKCRRVRRSWDPDGDGGGDCHSCWQLVGFIKLKSVHLAMISLFLPIFAAWFSLMMSRGRTPRPCSRLMWKVPEWAAAAACSAAAPWEAAMALI